MSLAGDLRSRRPFLFDQLASMAGRAAHRAAPLDKQYAEARGVSVSRATRHRNGCADNPLINVLLAFRQLARDAKTTAIPLLLEVWAIVMSVEIEGLSNDDVLTQHEQLSDAEHDAEALESRRSQKLDIRTSTPEEDEAAADAELVEAEIQVRRAQIRRDVARRKRENRWFFDGLRRR